MEAEGTDERHADGAELVELLVAYQAGRLEAFERFYARLAGDLGRYFAAMVPAGSAASDLVQDTFLEIHRSRRTYLPPLPVRPWVFGIARHVLGRHRKAAARRAHEHPLDVNGEPAGAAAPAIDPLDLSAALAKLPAARRQSWVLHHVHGWSFEEIAGRLEIGIGAAKLRSSRAMKALRATLGLTQGGSDG
jgi:RNA polymerase sigma factor (sigma-70 family)